MEKENSVKISLKIEILNDFVYSFAYEKSHNCLVAVSEQTFCKCLNILFLRFTATFSA